MKNQVEAILKKTPYLKQIFLERDQLRIERDQLQNELMRIQFGWPPGHFYSPIPSLDDVRSREGEIFRITRTIPGVDLNEEGQIRLFDNLKPYYAEQPFQPHKQNGRRYFFQNPNFSYGEAILLYCLMRYLRPKKIIEIGSGYSSCVILDTNELFFDDAITCTFIEPYPQLLESLIWESDSGRVEILRRRLQDVATETFSDLSTGDILFIDSTHVSKVDSDVNHIVFRILPHLANGVYIHFHDILYPFEYPKGWVYEGRAWNEAYLLRAFLQYNHAYQIQFFNSFFAYSYADTLMRGMPLCMENPGTSLWLKKI